MATTQGWLRHRPHTLSLSDVAAACLLATGCGPILPQIDMRPRLVATARNLASTEDAPVWQRSVGYPDVRILLPLGQRGLLVDAGRLSLYHVTNGQLVWQVDSVAAGAELVSIAPLLLLSRSEKATTLLALNDSTGRVLWRRQVARSHVLSVGASGQTVFVAELLGSRQVRLSAINARRDSLLWTRERRWRQLPRLAVSSPDRLLVMGDTTEALSTTDGSVQWRLSDVRTERLIATGDGYIIFSATGDVTSVDSAGRARWRVPASPAGASPSFARDENQIVVAWSSDSVPARIASIRLADGRVLWERRAVGSVSSNLVLTDSVLVFSTALQGMVTLRIWALSTGRPIIEPRLPEQSRHLPSDSTMRAYGRTRWIQLAALRLPCAELPATEVNLLADVIVPYPDRIVVAQETSVGAVSRQAGDVLWWHRIDSPEFTAGCAELNRLAAIEYARVNKVRGGASVGADVMTIAASGRRFAEERAAEQWRVYESRRFTGRATAADRERAATEGQIAHQQAVAMAWLEFAGSFMAIAEAQQAGYFDKRTGLIRSMSQLAPQLHNGAIQGDFYVRAFSRGARTGPGEASWSLCDTGEGRADRGGIRARRPCYGSEGRSGVLIVDLRTGAWREITTGPWESGTEALALNVQMPVVAEGGRLLVAAAPGLDTAQWTGAPRVRTLFITAPQSILAFDLGRLSLRPVGEYASRETQLRGRPLSLSAHVSSIRNGATTEDELTEWFGPPTLRETGLMEWESLREVHGRVQYLRLHCGMVGRVVQHCETGPATSWILR